MALSWNEIKDRALKFSNEWAIWLDVMKLHATKL